MNHGQQLLRRLEALAPADQRMVLDGAPEEAVMAFHGDWPSWAHPGQIPEHDEWRVWVMLAGRGFGKTRAGAEWVSRFARETPDARIALVGATADEARRVMVEGASGLLAVARPSERQEMSWEPSLGRLRFAGGAEAQLFSASNPEALRGPEHHIAWCDELAKWPSGRAGGHQRGEAAWDNLTLGLRLGEKPQALVTTTPRAVPLLRRILGEEGAVLTGGASRNNPHLPDAFIGAIERIHGGTRFGRQELEGELIEEVEGALWPRALIDACRILPGTGRGTGAAGGGGFEPAPGPPPPPCGRSPSPRCGEDMRRIVIGVDPPAGVGGDACGIIAVGMGADGIGYVLGDHSVSGLSPEGWALKVAAAAEVWAAERVVAEANNGGAMVEAVLRGAGLALPVRLVHAAEGKAARAAPVAALFESGRAKLAGHFPALEDELAGLSWGGDYQGPGRHSHRSDTSMGSRWSPDRADAMVWALTELMLGKARAQPRITFF